MKPLWSHRASWDSLLRSGRDTQDLTSTKPCPIILNNPCQIPRHARPEPSPPPPPFPHSHPHIPQKHVRIRHQIIIKPIPRPPLPQIPPPIPCVTQRDLRFHLIGRRECDVPVQVRGRPQRLAFGGAEIVADGHVSEEDDAAGGVGRGDQHSVQAVG